MNRTMLRAKIHRITVTDCDIQYEGSLTLDPQLMAQADMMPFERVEVYDVDNGNRFATYLIEGRYGSGDCCVNGAAARLVAPGDKLILASFVTLKDDAVSSHRPRLVLIGEHNRVQSVERPEPAAARS